MDKLNNKRIWCLNCQIPKEIFYEFSRDFVSLSGETSSILFDLLLSNGREHP
jgi:hypothetical protein